MITECLRSVQAENLEEIYGPGEFEIHPAKLAQFEQRRARPPSFLLMTGPPVCGEAPC